MFGAFGGGYGIGVARGAIQVDVSQLTTAHMAVLSFASGVGNALTMMNVGLRGTTQQAAQAGLGLGNMFVMVAVGGIAAADRIRRLDAVTQILSGNAERYAQNMQLIKQFAEEFNQ